MTLNNEIQIAGYLVKPFTSVSTAADWILKASDGHYKGAAIALNAEKIANNYEQSSYLDTIKPFSFFYADGAPIVRLLRRNGIESARIPGVELWEELMKRAGKLGLRVYLLGATEETNKETAKKLALQYGLTKLKRHNGFFKETQTILKEIKEFKPHIITVAQGSPRQEQFIAQAYAAYPHAFYMGVGGTYDVYTGKIKRAPRWMCENGLEFLYRFIINPSRIKRYLSLFKFMYLYLTKKI